MLQTQSYECVFLYVYYDNHLLKSENRPQAAL